MAYGDMGMYEEAIAAHERAAAANARWKYALGRTYAMSGREEDARAIANELERSPSPLQAWGLAILYTALNDVENAMRWVEVAYENRHPWTPWFSAPPFALLHGESRFQEIMRTMKLEPASRPVRKS